MKSWKCGQGYGGPWSAGGRGQQDRRATQSLALSPTASSRMRPRHEKTPPAENGNKHSWGETRFCRGQPGQGRWGRDTEATGVGAQCQLLWLLSPSNCAPSPTVVVEAPQEGLASLTDAPGTPAAQILEGNFPHHNTVPVADSGGFNGWVWVAEPAVPLGTGSVYMSPSPKVTEGQRPGWDPLGWGGRNGSKRVGGVWPGSWRYSSGRAR